MNYIAEFADRCMIITLPTTNGTAYSCARMHIAFTSGIATISSSRAYR